MGVKGLWDIISPLSERKPLYELEGKTIAVDLSCWIVDSQNISTQPKMHIRNLFFRTSYFLLHNVTPIFVLEGTAPTLKHGTIARRNLNRPGAEERKTTKKGGRSHFKYVLKECKEMLTLMGANCIQGEGEAEALCAYLNEDGLVDGCISQDSDCFLYGAKVVYRNFCTVKQGSSGSIDEYSIDKIQSVQSLGRNKMVALALICGCDYDEGLFGVGKEAALKFFKTVEDSEVLERMKQWKTSSKFDRMEAELSNPDICTNCGHFGKTKSHTRIGCVDCGTSVKCNDSYKEKRALMTNELNIRKKAQAINNFPNQELIDEFLASKGSVPSRLDLKWGRPNIIKFIRFMERVVQWEPEYSLEKILPIATRWQLEQLKNISDKQEFEEAEAFVPEKIKKVRIVRGVASFEILWTDKNNVLKELKNMLSEKENLDALTKIELVTVEPQELILKLYPSIVNEFMASKQKPKRPREGVKKNKKVVLKNKKITDFIQMKELEESLESIEITPKKKRGPQFNKVLTTEKLDDILNGSLELMFSGLTPNDFPSDNDFSESEMSIIIGNICNKKSIAL